ncbi:MAG: NAD(P)H-binding protein [Myxococcales bacterium]|nr:NAD(P)H-binding protein [Polyangiaceae bacterium]MDW8250476.1 NAD(P)H-binding protein [Myxococcales bacterium]
MAPRQVVVAGGTGLVGRQVLRQLAARSDVEVTALVRRTGAGLPEGVRERSFDYEQEASYEALGGEIPCDLLLCCLGTTRKKAGSNKAFRRVDRDYPLRLLNRLQQLPGRPVFGLVSSVGADRGIGLYLKTKAEVEEAVRSSGLPYVMVRPSLLVGEREESRLGERLVLAISVPLFGVLQHIVPKEMIARYAPIEGSQVASALIRGALDTREPHLILEGTELLG